MTAPAQRSAETLRQFHARQIKRCIVVAETFEKRAIAVDSLKRKEHFQAKAQAERRNADFHRQKLLDMGSTGLHD